MSQNLQNFVKFQKFQLENLVDFEKCCKTRIFLQKSVPIQPKTSKILSKICQKFATTVEAALELPDQAVPQLVAVADGQPAVGPPRDEQQQHHLGDQ